MKGVLLAISIILIAYSEVIPRIRPIDSHAPLTYKVQISDPPMTRWAPLIRDYNASLHRFL